MWRKIHAWVGLTLAVLVIALAVTGSVLATRPLYQAYLHSGESKEGSVADLIERIATANPRIQPQRLSFSHSGEATLSYQRNNRTKENLIALDTGEFSRGVKEPKQYEFFQNLHRSFMLGEKGRYLPAAGGVAMTLLVLSGLFLLFRRLGGPGRFFSGIRLGGIADLHAILGRLLLIPLCLMAVTALWLSGVTFKIIPSGEDKPPAYPESLEELDPVDPWTLHGLKEIPIADAREIVFPIADDWFDVWTVRTAKEYVFIDQFTGDVISREPVPALARAKDWVMALHTGRSSVAWALVLLLSALSIPFFAISGVVVWWRNKRKGKGRIRHNAKAAKASTLVLVGSEGGATWGFAKALHEGLDKAGLDVRTIEMNGLQPHYPQLQRILALTSTYGSGDAPASATHFLAKLAKNRNRDVAWATLAFGDKAFADYCAFGEAVDKALAEHCGGASVVAEPEDDSKSTSVDADSSQEESKSASKVEAEMEGSSKEESSKESPTDASEVGSGSSSGSGRSESSEGSSDSSGASTEAARETQAGPLLEIVRVDKQSQQTFKRWCDDLGTKLGVPLVVDYSPKRPKTREFSLVFGEVYGRAMGTTIAVLRFEAVGKLPAFEPGDLVEIYPPDCAVPRLYSIGSSSRRDRFLEICVRLQEGGLCSPWLCAMEVGQRIDVAFRRNDRFGMPKKGPVIMIGAGTGLSPFTGMIRHNLKKLPVDLYWGGRHPEVDDLYGEQIAQWTGDGRLARYRPAWSRGERREYVQDVVGADREHLLERLKGGATIMICGGGAMAAGVREKIAPIAAELGLTIAELKRRGRFMEDVY